MWKGNSLRIQITLQKLVLRVGCTYIIHLSGPSTVSSRGPCKGRRTPVQANTSTGVNSAIFTRDILFGAGNFLARKAARSRPEIPHSAFRARHISTRTVVANQGRDGPLRDLTPNNATSSPSPGYISPLFPPARGERGNSRYVSKRAESQVGVSVIVMSSMLRVRPFQDVHRTKHCRSQRQRSLKDRARG